MTDKISNLIDLEMAANQFQEAITVAYNENYHLTVRKNNMHTSCWNQGLAKKRRKVRKLFNLAKKSADWTDYKSILIDYNKALTGQRETWRRHCEDIEKAPECARLHRIPSKDE
jgi:hypothetical protein